MLEPKRERPAGPGREHSQNERRILCGSQSQSGRRSQIGWLDLGEGWSQSGWLSLGGCWSQSQSGRLGLGESRARAIGGAYVREAEPERAAEPGR